MTLNLLTLDGDGIGPEIVSAAKSVIEATRLPVKWTKMEVGFAALSSSRTTIPQDVVNIARKVDGVLLGPVSHNDYPPIEQGGLNPSGVLRKKLELFANIRPAKSFDGLPSATGAEFDLVIYRENLEGFYADRNMESGSGEIMVTPDTAIALRKITSIGSERIAREAFSAAAKRSGRLVAIHKANVMRVSDGVFLKQTRTIAKEYPDVEYSEMLVDAAAAHLVRNPAQFDVIVTTNMFGDILSDLASELSGGLGLAGSLNKGEDALVAQAQHGSAPDIAGQNLANPTSMILSAAMLLDALGQTKAARSINKAVEAALAEPSTRTKDIGGTLNTSEFAEHVISNLDMGVR